MRKAPGKKFGYIIIPITVPASESYQKIVLDRKFNPTFQVLQALKSHDEDFLRHDQPSGPEGQQKGQRSHLYGADRLH